MNEPYVSPAEIKKRESARRMRAIWTGVIIATTFIALVVLLLAQGLEKLSVNIWGIGVGALLALAGFGCAWLAWRGQATAGGAALLAVTLLVALTTPIIGHGQGIALGLLTLILGFGITAAAFPAKHITTGGAISLAVAAAVVALDQILPDFGFYTEPIYTYVISAVLSAVFLGIVALQFNRLTLRTKMAFTFALVTLIPLAALGAYNISATSASLNQKSRESLQTLAQTTAETYDNFIAQRLNETNMEAKQIALADFLALPPFARENSVEKRKAELTLASFQSKDAVFIDSYGVLDVNGKNILDTSLEDLGRDESAQEYYLAVIKSGAPYASNVLFIEEGDSSIYFSAPIRDASNRVVGVLRVEYRATILQNIARALLQKNPNTQILLTDLETHLRLAYTGDRAELFKSYRPMSEAELAAFQAQGKLPPGNKEQVLAGVNEQLAANVNRIEARPFFQVVSPSLGGESLNAGANLKTQRWAAVVRESSAQNQQAVERQRKNIILISLALALAAILLGVGGAQILAAPILALIRVSERVAAGDLHARASVKSMDEIGLLSQTFNRMAEQMQATLSGMEEQIAARTAALEATQRQSEKRANELQSVGEISKIITSEQRMDVLLPLITRLVSERFGFYHTGVFLLDETRQYAVLQAANSEGGKRMLARGHRLELGKGVVGYVAKSGLPRIALDVGADSVFFNNPDLPATRSEMALPLKIRNQVIGVLDAQSETARAFTENDAANLSILADQIAIAVENARLFERTQQALSEAQTLYRQSAREGWAFFSAEEGAIGYRQTLKGGEKLQKPIESEEIREAVNRGTPLYYNADGERESYIVIPIKVRGQVIGALDVKAPDKNRQWTSDEINFVETVSERLSIALENARLIRASQRQVVKQQTIRDMTEKISASINLKNVLQTAVEELGRVIPGSEVVLRLTSQDDAKETERPS